jgi:uncharacterized protein (TIGR03083 family)
MPRMQDDVIASIAAQRADLLTFLQQVNDKDWARTTACAPWTMKDVLAHLVDGELNVGRIYRGEVRALGYMDPDAGIANWSALPGEAVRAALWQHGTAVQRVLEAMTPDAWNAPIEAFGCRQIAQLVRLHLFDLTMHSHDLTEAMRAEPVWGPRLPFLVEFVVRAAPRTLTRRGIAPHGALEVRTGDRVWTIDGRGDQWTLTTVGAPEVLDAEPADLVRAVTGRADVAQVIAGSSVQGDPAQVRAMLDGWQVLAR